MVDALGRIVGQEVGRVAGNVQHMNAEARIEADVGLLLINHIAVTSVITMANDRIGNIVDDAAHDAPTFEVPSTPI